MSKALVRVTGLEPAQLSPPGPKPGASTNSATPASLSYSLILHHIKKNYNTKYL